MKAQWNIKPSELIKSIESNVKVANSKWLEAVSKDIEKNARRNFNQALNDISGDDPHIEVVRTVNGNSATVKCIGSQVLFAEFGAGINNSFTERDISVGEHTRVSSSGTTYRVKGHTRTIVYSARGFEKGGTEEYIERPAGIVPLGTYGKGQGMKTVWVRHTDNGRVGNNEEADRGGRTDIIWTRGTRPVRGLWRATNLTRHRLATGRLNVK